MIRRKFCPGHFTWRLSGGFVDFFAFDHDTWRWELHRHGFTADLCIALGLTFWGQIWNVQCLCLRIRRFCADSVLLKLYIPSSLVIPYKVIYVVCTGSDARHTKVAMLIIMAGAYFLDEQTRLQSFGQAHNEAFSPSWVCCGPCWAPFFWIGSTGYVMMLRFCQMVDLCICHETHISIAPLTNNDFRILFTCRLVM